MIPVATKEKDRLPRIVDNEEFYVKVLQSSRDWFEQ